MLWPTNTKELIQKDASLAGYCGHRRSCAVSSSHFVIYLNLPCLLICQLVHHNLSCNFSIANGLIPSYCDCSKLLMAHCLRRFGQTANNPWICEQPEFLYSIKKRTCNKSPINKTAKIQFCITELYKDCY